MLALIVAVVAVFAAMLRGGSLDRLAATPVRRLWLVFAGFGIQLLFAYWHPGWLEGAASLAIVLASNALVVAFVVLNRSLPGMLLIGLGLTLNAIVIAANGAMPVSAAAAEAAGTTAPRRTVELKHERAGTDTVLAWLGDVIPVPGLGQVLSIGDIVLAAGIGRFTYARTRDRAEVREPEASD